ncbi:MAG: hypothetical protein ACJAQT_005061 [Akkermansiaceae bacterium]|jgi:hypothetical protein
MAKIGKGKAFGLRAAYQEFPNNQHGWLHFSVNDEIARPGSYADNRGSLVVSAFVDRPHQTLARRITLGKINLTPLSLQGDQDRKVPSLYLKTQDLEAEVGSPQLPAVFLRTEPSTGTTRIAVTAIKINADTYAFVAENYPSAPGIDTSRHSPYLILGDDQTVEIRWTRDLYSRAFFHLRPPSRKNPVRMPPSPSSRGSTRTSFSCSMVKEDFVPKPPTARKPSIGQPRGGSNTGSSSEHRPGGSRLLTAGPKDLFGFTGNQLQHSVITLDDPPQSTWFVSPGSKSTAGFTKILESVVR